MPKKAAKTSKTAKAAKKVAAGGAKARPAARSGARPRKGATVSAAKPKSGAPATAKRKPATPKPKPAVRPKLVQVPERLDGNERGAKVDSTLSKSDIEQFHQMLMEKRAEILGDVHTLHSEALNKDRREAAGDLSSMPIHMADLGTDNYELEFTLGLIEGERAILREIEEALDRIRKGTYGVCLATGKPIGKARLKAKPWAKYCYEYTLAQEQGQRRF